MVVNTHQQMTGDFTRNADFAVSRPVAAAHHHQGRGRGQAEFVDATRMATALLGDSIATNMFMLGYAYQKGLVPVSAEAINKAIELNGAAVKMNQAAFLWGRRAAVDLDCGRAADRAQGRSRRPAPSSRSRSTRSIRRRVEFLTGYQNAAYAEKYARWSSGCARRKQPRPRVSPGLPRPWPATTSSCMAYKDEYEVARLYTDSGFADKIKAQFEGDYKLHFHLAPPLLAKRNDNGELIKARVRAVDVRRVQGCWRSCAACAGRRWTSSATPRSAAPSGS